MRNNIGKAYRSILGGDGASFVRLDATLPDPSSGKTLDDMIVMAARTSYSKGLKDPESDKKLVKYLLDNEHMSPFEQPQVTFTVRLPKMAIIQLLRHRSFHFNSESGRYVEVKDEFYMPREWRLQSTQNKQGSEGILDAEKASYLDGAYINHVRLSTKLYREALDWGVAKELARIFLPADAGYVTVMFTADLRNLINFLKQRLDGHAQYEIRQAACAMYWLLLPQCFNTFDIVIDKIFSDSAARNLLEFGKEYGEPENDN